jgi:hypothetical protein
MRTWRDEGQKKVMVPVSGIKAAWRKLCNWLRRKTEV